MTLPLFDSDGGFPPQTLRLASVLRSLAGQGVYFGTSSWRYEGWLGQIYTLEKYLVRGRFSRKKFEAECLSEYAATFPVVGGDFSFYYFPSVEYWDRLFGATPATLRFGLKVPEEITVHTWPRHARYGARAGQLNERFLDASLFERSFARLLDSHRDRIAALMFEFGTFGHQTFAHVSGFLEPLARFLAALPAGFRYAVEIRNPEFLSSEYFSVLAAHNVAHVFNAWTRMPPLGEQIALAHAFTADFTVVRALLRTGRPYEQAVRMFEPYRHVQEPDPATRDGMRQVVDRALRTRQPAFLFVNNRLEGNAPQTIEAVVSAMSQ